MSVFGLSIGVYCEQRFGKYLVRLMGNEALNGELQKYRQMYGGLKISVEVIISKQSGIKAKGFPLL